uniref:Carboxylesterase type B domain-containing protein n=1 Tax=Timema genevievae TaxID=629358 RepID=A0A7R9JUH7_TIMGE|nr:unnamed protein product [Timema genevievae]
MRVIHICGKVTFGTVPLKKTVLSESVTNHEVMSVTCGISCRLSFHEWLANAPVVLSQTTEDGEIEKNGTAVISECNGTVTLNVTGGNIMGRIKSTKSSKTFYSFQGIPYAAPPVGDLRFKSPQAVESWDGVRSALEIGSSCLQPYLSKVSGSEDCLFLNVYTPQGKIAFSSSNGDSMPDLPVIGSTVYYKSDALHHAATEAGGLFFL